jgi:hypothetical protein
MTCARRLAIVLVGALCPGCAAAHPVGPASPTADPPPPAATQLLAAQRLLGEWVMAPPPHEERSVALARFALQTPPDDAAFEAMQPSETERTHYTNLLRLQNEEPHSPLLAEVRRRLDGLDGVRVTFTPEKMITTTPSGTEVVPYVVEEDLGDRVVIAEHGDPMKQRMIAFDGDDRIVISVGPTRVPMTRVGAGVPVTPTSAPTTRAGGNVDDLDGCVAEYYRCIDQMPAETRASMTDLIAATKQVFERARQSPQEAAFALQSCRQAVDLAYATYCSRP